MQAVRPAAVAGAFYPEDPVVLEGAVRTLLADARARIDPTGPRPSAAILPHAGYAYSGPIAALGYAALAPHRESIDRVVLLGPTHRVAVDGLALAGAESFRTPLGDVPVAEVDERTRAALPQLVESAPAHRQEHSLEVHLPFIQLALGDVEILPLAVGRATPAEVADVIAALTAYRSTVVIVSSDLSHYLPHEAAVERDRATVEQILRLDGPVRHEQACGATPLNGLIEFARRTGLGARPLGRCTSADTAGEPRRVVGYAAILLAPR